MVEFSTISADVPPDYVVNIERSFDCLLRQYDEEISQLELDEAEVLDLRKERYALAVIASRGKSSY
jgi:hypothetical protein